MHKQAFNKATPGVSVATGKAVQLAMHQLGSPARFYDSCERHGVSKGILKSDDNKIPLNAVLDFTHEQATLLNEPMLGVKMGQLFNIKKLPRSLNLLFVAQDVKQALEMFDRYTQVFSDVGRFELVRNRADCRLVFKPVSANPNIRYLIEGVVMTLLTYMRSLGVDVFSSLHLSHACPSGYQQQYQDEFALPVNFDCQETWFAVNPKILFFNLDNCSNPSFEFFEEAEKWLQDFKGESSLDEQVTFILNNMVSTRQISAERMAGVLGMNMRTFQRRLKLKKLTYRDLLEKSKKSLATQYLAHEDMSIDEVARQLGYNDKSNFYRAFKNWTGMPPAQYRSTFQTIM